MKEEALRLKRARLSPVPILKPLDPDSKSYQYPWRRFQSIPMTEREIERNFANAWGIGVVAGKVSGVRDEELVLNGLTVLDFDGGEDNLFGEFSLLCDDLYPGLLHTCPVERTLSGGIHLYLRSPICEGNQKLAMRERKTLIETRGEGGLIFCSPTPGYSMLWGDLAAIPSVSEECYGNLTMIAKSLGDQPKQYVPGGTRAMAPSRTGGVGDRYNASKSWEEVLAMVGAKICGSHGERLHVTRPGKKSGTSATTGNGHDGKDLLYCFSSNWHPLEPGRCYSKYALFALLVHGGDWRAAALAAKKELKSTTLPMRRYELA
jgi:hypothetical protein